MWILRSRGLAAMASAGVLAALLAPIARRRRRALDTAGLVPSGVMPPPASDPAEIEPPVHTSDATPLEPMPDPSPVVGGGFQSIEGLTASSPIGPSIAPTQLPSPPPTAPMSRPAPTPAPAELPAPASSLAPTPTEGPAPALRTASADAETFRPDVEGLRGIAILLVLMFHSALPVPGGFVGVDVFFVISGFLITGMLLREIGRSGGIALDRFYARRIRRLLPAAAVTLAVTLPIAYAVVVPLDRASAMDDGMAAMLSVSNIRFALAEGDYFAAANGPSPFLHFWSLSLEEQFYLFWPLALLLVARGRRANLRAGIALTVVLVVSLGASVLVTDASATWAFYSLPTRAWQFAAGGLLAIGVGLVARIPTLLAAPAGWAGVGILVASALALDGSLAYPGIAAVAPTAAAVLLIASGERRWGPGRVLATRPLRFLGRISYSLYLWHWPILLLPAIALGAALEPAVNIALCGVAVIVAWVSWAFVERRFRYPMAKGSRAPRRSLATGAVSMALVVALAWSLDLAAVGSMSAGVTADGGSRTDEIATEDRGPVSGADAPGEAPTDAGPSPTTPPDEHEVVPPSHDLPPTPRPSPAPSPTPTPTPAPSWETVPEAEPATAVPLPRDVAPSLTRARNDIERLYADGCVAQAAGTKPADCVYGDPKGDLTIALVGDSHAGHWFPAFNVLASRHGWRLVPYVKVSCAFVDMPVMILRYKREYTECETWRGRVIAALNKERPDLIVVGSGYRAIIAARPRDASPAAQGAAMARAIAQLDSPVAIIIDNPRASYDIPGCLSKHPKDVRACAISRAEAFPDQYGLRERAAAEATGAGLLDLSATVCPATPCQVMQDGMILYRDNHHLTATFVRSLAWSLDAALASVLAAPENPGPMPDPAAGPRAPRS